MEKKLIIFVSLIGASFAMLILAVSIPKGILFAPFKILIVLIAAILDVAALSSRYYLYIIQPIAQQRKRYIVLSDENPYHLSPSGDSILRKEGEEYIAMAYVSIPIYKSASEMSPEEKIAFATQISLLTTILKNPVRYSTEMYVMNKDNYISTLRDAVDKAEDEQVKLTQAKAEGKKIERVRGQLTMWRNMLEAVSSSPSFELATYASVSAKGYKEYEAVASVQQRAGELIAGIGSVLGVTPLIVTGDDLLKFVEPECLIPYSTISEEINENLMKEGGF
jgi:hypothetical protein